MVLIFMFQTYYPAGGMGDCKAIVDSIDSANEFIESVRLALWEEDYGMDYDYITAYDCITRTHWTWADKSNAFIPVGR